LRLRQSSFDVQQYPVGSAPFGPGPVFVPLDESIMGDCASPPASDAPDLNPLHEAKRRAPKRT
jgi:hypothetical protein